jgi:hypothetical protein
MLTLAMKLLVDQLLFGPFLFSSFLIFVGYFDSVTSNHKFADTFVNFFKNVLQGHLAGMSYWLPVGQISASAPAQQTRPALSGSFS